MLNRIDYEERVVIVTGAAGHLGRAVVPLLATLNARVETPRDPVDGGPDLAREEAVHRWYRRHPSMWASIHLAGGFAMADVGDTGEDMLEHLWRTNARTCFLCCREAIRRFREQGAGGRIVNVAARAALEPRNAAGMAAYAVSKTAVAAMTEVLGEEVASENVFVNAIAPSILDTADNRRAQPDADYSTWVSLEAAAEMIAFLASPQNRTIRSAVLPLYASS